MWVLSQCLSVKSLAQLLHGIAALAPMLFGQAACSGFKLKQEHESIRFLKPSCDQVSPASSAFPWTLKEDTTVEHSQDLPLLIWIDQSGLSLGSTAPKDPTKGMCPTSCLSLSTRDPLCEPEVVCQGLPPESAIDKQFNVSCGLMLNCSSSPSSTLCSTQEVFIWQIHNILPNGTWPLSPKCSEFWSDAGMRPK